MVTSPLAKNRTLYRFLLTLLDSGTAGDIETEWIATTSDGDIKMFYRDSYNQGSDLTAFIAGQKSTFEADLVSLGYVLT